LVLYKKVGLARVDIERLSDVLEKIRWMEFLEGVGNGIGGLGGDSIYDLID